MLVSFRRRLEYVAFLIISFPVKYLSAKMVYRLGKIFGCLLFKIGGKRKKIAQNNLEIAFGDSKTYLEKEKIILNSFCNSALSLLQCVWVGASPKERIKEIIPNPPTGVENFQKCLERKKGMFVLVAHYGNWELMGISHGYLGLTPLHSIVRKLDNPYLDRLAENFRCVSGNSIFYKTEPPLRMVRTVKKNGCIAVMMDQNTAKGGIFVDFFGKPAATARSIALLSISTGAAILPFFSFPEKNGQYRIQYGPEISFTPSGDKEKDVFDLTQRCVSFLESVIRETPDPWMWVHRRWKTRPTGEVEKVYF